MDSSLYVPWFSVGEADEDAFGTLDGAWRRFVSVLRERAVSLPCDPDDTLILRPEETGFAHLLALLYVVRPETNSVSHVYGAFFDGQGVLGTELHNQMYIPLHGGMLRVAGSPGRCAELTADWFDHILRDQADNPAAPIP
ncbi:hypothetical protein E0500_019815 [Streptomyces sp. KM273126]|uniref:hypothetical protein n=1 Tax=Streptomyces sp. KM273126 TaxID=2545247 RepID=UPI00103923B9|nr:hypothetical protein [Streptomyces sp. KM273126]MBA2809581.1 hypothetical protein [Streptomyces sp. KM273126]